MDVKGTAIFCDDIRLEASGQSSLIGCYSGLLIVHQSFPVTLPKLGVFALIDAPRHAPPHEIIVTISLEPDGETLFETRIATDDDARDDGLDDGAPSGEDDAHGRLIRFAFNVVLAPVDVKGEGWLRARARVDGTVVKLGSLRITSASAPPER